MLFLGALATHPSPCMKQHLMLAVPSNEYWVRACLVNLLTDHPEPRQRMPARCWELDAVPDIFVPESLWLGHLFPPLLFYCFMFESWPDSALFTLMLYPLSRPLPNLPPSLAVFYPDICADNSTSRCISAGRAACPEARQAEQGTVTSTDELPHEWL